MEILKITGLAVTGVLLSALVKSQNKDISIYIILATSIIIIISILNRVTEIFAYIENIYDQISYGREFFPVIIKVLAVAYITDFTSQICKDAGENTISSKVELAGKVMIFYIAMPILTAIIRLIGTLLN